MSSGDLIILKQTVHHFLALILLSGNKVFSLLGITNKENLKGWIRNNFLRFGFLIFFFILVIITFNTQIKLVLISLIFDISIQNILINQQENRVIFAIFSNTKDYVNLKLVHETKKKLKKPKKAKTKTTEKLFGSAGKLAWNWMFLIFKPKVFRFWNMFHLF